MSMVYIFLGRGFEEIEAVTPCDILRRGGVETCYVGIDTMNVTGGHGITLEADVEITDVRFTADDYIVIPGGMGGVEAIEDSERAISAIRFAKSAGTRLAAICAGPRVFAKLGLLSGKKITCYPGLESQMTGAEVMTDMYVVADGDLITGRSPGAAVEFGLALLEKIKGFDAANKVREELAL